MDYNTELTNLLAMQEGIQRELSTLEGEYSLLSKQIEESTIKIENINNKRIIYKKSIEFLRKVEEATKETTSKGFEALITLAVRSICQGDYGFKFQFKKRGNRQELNYLIKTPKCKEYHDPLDSQAGGVLDCVSVALRIALLEKTKTKGLICFDESFKALDANHIPNAGEFLRTIHERINRQIIFVTHKKELANYADNKIELT